MSQQQTNRYEVSVRCLTEKRYTVIAYDKEDAIEGAKNACERDGHSDIKSVEIIDSDEKEKT